MQFVPYSHTNGAGVMQMLTDHFDFTPQLDSGDNNQENIDCFKVDYEDGEGRGICYVLKAEDDSIAGLLEASKYDFPNGAACWYISSLFVRNDDHADQRALSMVDGFFGSIHDSNELCANVHPGAAHVIAFWLRNGFTPNPERSVFSNVFNERLTAYWKKR